MVLRYALVNAPYRQPIDFNQVLLDDAEKNHGRLIESIISAGGIGIARQWSDIESLKNAEDSLMRGMDDDLNTRVAIAEMQSVVKMLRQANSSQDHSVASACVGWLSAYAGDVLGLLPDEESLQRMVGQASERRDEIREKVESFIAMREEARSERNWAEADRIRDVISELGVVIEDGESGTIWRMKDL
jgi:cysteinyl-tRNA synthetase